MLSSFSPPVERVALPFPAMVLSKATDNGGNIATSFQGTLEVGDGIIDMMRQPDSSPRHIQGKGSLVQGKI